MSDTIYALASGRPPVAVAIIRVSGPSVRFVIETICGSLPAPRRASLRKFRHPAGGEIIDEGLVIHFAGTSSFTGEDSCEFHLHGGRAVVAAMLGALGSLPGLRPAEAGEFTRRAFENGRLDLTAVESLGDLIAAETELQRRQALAGASGALAHKAEDWRRALVEIRAMIEADLDFADEEDIPGSISDEALPRISALRQDLARTLGQSSHGERIRDGLQVALMGPPNAGKSSLLNALARREVAIVTDQPGTTRDLLEVHLDIGGLPVTLIDTAGIREATDGIEAEGIRRGRLRGATADLVLWLDEAGAPAEPDILALGPPVLAIRTKADLGGGGDALAISVQDDASLDRLVAIMAEQLRGAVDVEPALVTHARQRHCIEGALQALDLANGADLPPELVAEHMRGASDALGRLTGRIDTEDVLGAIFSRFCIGK